MPTVKVWRQSLLRLGIEPYGMAEGLGEELQTLDAGPDLNLVDVYRPVRVRSVHRGPCWRLRR